MTLLICAVATIHDGDTIRCETGERVRLSGIDAPELHGCHGRPGRICVPGDGQSSRRALEQMIAGKTLRCRVTGQSYNRLTAWCYDGRVDISCRMVAIGQAVVWSRYWRGHVCGRYSRWRW